MSMSMGIKKDFKFAKVFDPIQREYFSCWAMNFVNDSPIMGCRQF